MAEYQTQSKPLSAAFFKKDVFRDKKQPLLILKTGVAGFKHHIDLTKKEDMELYESLVPGTKLNLFRDMDNIHDKFAVSIYTKDDVQIGYISRFKVETMARLLDYGKKIYAIVDEQRIPPEDPTEYRRTIAPTEGWEVTISVYMEED